MSALVSAVMADLADREKRRLGWPLVRKGREDLTHRDWLRHAYEEALDTAVYLKKAMQELDAAKGNEDGV